MYNLLQENVQYIQTFELKRQFFINSYAIDVLF